MPDRDTLLSMAESERRFMRPAIKRAYQAGDLIYLGEGITWRVSASLAASLNRQIVRDSLPIRSRAALIGGEG